jgi:hypothetical protein
MAIRGIMGMMRLLPPLLLLVLFAPGALARGEHKVEVLDTYPAGRDVTLGPGEKFHVRIGYSTDSQTRIFVRPYLDGREVRADTSPSPAYRGSGETAAWFSLPDTGDRVDEIRIFVGNSKRRLGASYEVSIASGAATAAPAPAPDWVAELENRVVEATGGPQPEPTTAEKRWFTGFMLGVSGLALFGLVAPAWGFLRWRGRWRIAAAIPMVGMGLFAVFLLLVAVFDPDSLGLLPLVVLLGAVPSSLFMAILFIARRFAGAHRGQSP